MNALESLFNPNSVAIIGASSDPTRISGRPVRYLIESNFKGAIYPINANRSEIQGLKAYPDIGSVGAPVDTAILAIASDDVVPTVRACAEHGVRNLVVFSSGFAEMGDAGEARQQELKAIARAGNMRVLGPNCLGAFNAHTGAFLTFSGVFEDVVGVPGRLGLVSQSGGYAGEVLKLALKRDLHFGTWVTTGNEADLELGEILGYLADSPDVDVILTYIEGVRSADSFIRAAELARRSRKPVIALKVGRTATGAEAAASHTAALAGADVVYDNVFHELGIYRARTTEEMLDVAYAALRGRFPKNNNVAILTNSGGIGVQAADFASDAGMLVPPAPRAVQEQLLKRVPAGGARNPVDVTGQAASDVSLMADTASALLDGDLYGSAYVCVGLLGGLAHMQRPLLDTFVAMMARHGDKPIAALVTAPREILAEYEAAGMLLYEDPSRALTALAALSFFSDTWRAPHSAAGGSQTAEILAPASALNEVAAKAVLARCGIAGPPEFLADGPVEGVAFAATIGAPVAIKIVSPDIMHKTDVGGVSLGVAPQDVAAAIDAMAIRVRDAAPAARVEGYLVSPMLTGGVECIVGANADPVFGPIVMFGLGGVTVEIYKDVTLRRAPVSEGEAMEMIRGIKGFPLLDGYRGRPAADLDALAAAIASVSRLAAANADRLRSIEINPLVVLPRGKGVVALDAIIETREPTYNTTLMNGRGRPADG